MFSLIPVLEVTVDAWVENRASVNFCQVGGCNRCNSLFALDRMDLYYSATNNNIEMELLMMKLKNLVDNRPLVLSLLSHWQYDEDAISILDQFRISANAVYPFYRFGEICFLRFAPVEEKEVESVQAELNFLAYLRERCFSVPEIVPTKNGSELLVINTDWGRFIAVVFKRIAGKKNGEP